MSISFPGTSAASSVPIASTPSSGSAKSSSSQSSQGNSIVQQFEQYANETPAQRMFDQMLGQLGITEDQYKSMTPSQQQQVQEKIQQMIKQQVQNSSNKRTGVITDVSA